MSKTSSSCFPVIGDNHVFHPGCKIIEGIKANCLEAPTSCLDALEFSLLFCYSLTCSCLLKLTCPLKVALKCLPFKILILHPVFTSTAVLKKSSNLHVLHLTDSLFSNLRGYCTPSQFLDCFCIFLKNYNTLVTSKICFLNR